MHFFGAKFSQRGAVVPRVVFSVGSEHLLPGPVMLLVRSCTVAATFSFIT